jgi:hypothetical protein
MIRAFGLAVTALARAWFCVTATWYEFDVNDAGSQGRSR